MHRSIDVEAGYYLSGDDLNGITDFNPGDKTFEWKLAYARPTLPVEFGLFGSHGSIPVSAGLNIYSSVAGHVQWRDGNPGLDSITGDLMPATSSRA